VTSVNHINLTGLIVTKVNHNSCVDVGSG